MTVIVYKDGVLAGDRMCCTPSDVIAGYRTKIFQHGNILAGSAGSSHDAIEFQKWVCEDYPDGPKPEIHDDHFEALIIDNGKIFRCNNKLRLVALDGECDAIGGGDEVAIGAMAMGASAQRAAEIACQFILGCGGGIDVLRLAPLAAGATSDPASQPHTNQTSTMGT